MAMRETQLTFRYDWRDKPFSMSPISIANVSPNSFDILVKVYTFVSSTNSAIVMREEANSDKIMIMTPVVQHFFYRKPYIN